MQIICGGNHGHGMQLLSPTGGMLGSKQRRKWEQRVKETYRNTDYYNETPFDAEGLYMGSYEWFVRSIRGEKQTRETMLSYKYANIG